MSTKLLNRQFRKESENMTTEIEDWTCVKLGVLLLTFYYIQGDNRKFLNVGQYQAIILEDD